MKILGDELIKFEPLFLCKSEDEISSGRQNLFKFDRNLIKRALEAGARVAQNYLFDALIAVLIQSETSLCELAKFEIDAAILPNAIKE